MRLTFNVIRDGLDAINNAADQFAAAQWQVATGRRLRAASDDPLAARQAVSDHAEVAALDSYTRSADAASSRLTMLDSVLGDMGNSTTDALTAAQSARGTVPQVVRDTAAVTLRGIRDALAGSINTTFNGTHLFAGSMTTTPYVMVAGAWTYQGNATTVRVDVDRSRSAAVSQDGQAIMKGTDASDLLTTLDTLATAAAAGDSAGLTAGIAAVNSALIRITHAQSQVGSDEKAIYDTQTRLTTLRLASASQLSKDQDANPVEAISRMNQAQLAYNAALAAVGKASKISLLDYI